MANFIVMEMAQTAEDDWSFTGRSFYITATSNDINEYVNNEQGLRSLNLACNKEFGTWAGVEILPIPNTRGRPTITKQ